MTDQSIDQNESIPHTTTSDHADSSRKEIGYVTSVNGYLVSVNGLPNVTINELIVHQSNARGIVIALNDEQVEVLMLDDIKIKPNELFTKTSRKFSISLSNSILGRTINPLGVPIDGKGRLTGELKSCEVFREARGITSRKIITEQLETGLTIIDLLVPIAKGQREMVIGDSRSGRASFLLDIVINLAKHSKEEKDSSIVCIYALVGKPANEIRRVVDVLHANQADSNTVVLATGSSDIASLIILGPNVAFTIAEFFQSQGKDVLVIIDDMGVHAKFYRESALLSNRAPGRQSYPGDIFFQHAKEVERAGSYNESAGGGSITAIPVIEADTEEMTGFITTNLMAMTDGHLFFDATRYHEGIRPPVDIGLSVSRVGRQTQGLIQKQLSDKLKSTMAQAKKLETYSRLGTETSTQTQSVLNQYAIITALLNQEHLLRIPRLIQMMMLGLVFTTFISKVTKEDLEGNKAKILTYLNTPAVYTPFKEQVDKMKDVSEFIEALEKIVPQVLQLFPQPQTPPVQSTTPINPPSDQQNDSVQTNQVSSQST
jgi:F-type H+/Na+-transporting ATPase subunit alpha